MRQAANYAIDREGICKSLLNGTCIPAIGEVYPGHPWFGNPTQRYEYNPAKAKELLLQAGYDGEEQTSEDKHAHLHVRFRPNAPAADE